MPTDLLQNAEVVTNSILRDSAYTHYARTKTRQAHKLTFIAIDGEGQGRGRNHRYVLLSVGNRSLACKWGKGLTSSDTMTLVDKPYLTYREIFPFLWDRFLENPEAAYVGFFLGYDFVHWIRDLPENRAKMLLTPSGIARRRRTGPYPTPFPVYVDEWEIDFLGMKRFRLRRHVHVGKKLDATTCECGAKADFVWGNDRPNEWMYVCDSGPFWQTSFLKAIDPKKWPKGQSPVSDSEYATIKQGKSGRGKDMLDAKMVEYNLLENEILSRITNLINDGLVAAGLRLTRENYYGPGQAAQAWLNLIGIPTARDLDDIVPPFARDAGRMSYFGGWFEVFMHGPVPGITYEYDINSAYPYIISQLPCLLHGEWTRGGGKPGKNKPTIRFVLAKVKGRSDAKVGTMLHRSYEGRISRPLETRGWYVWSELESARKAGLVTRCQIEEWMDYDGCDCKPPIAGIYELYKQRLVAGKNSPLGKALKLVYNSLYGKFAQSVGAPKYGNSIYATLITSGCRTMIVDAIAAHPDGIRDLVMVATDGVYFRTKHPNLPLDDEKLGAWAEGEKKNLSVFMPGIYWDDETRAGVQKEAENVAIRSRGIPASDLKTVIDDIDRQWTLDVPPIIELPIRFAMTSAVQALAWGTWGECGVVWEDKIRKIDGKPFPKRKDLRREGDVLVSSPHAIQGITGDSEPYDKRFGEMREELGLRPSSTDNFIMEDGTVLEVLGDSLRTLHGN